MSVARLDRLALLGSVAALAALQLWLRPLLPVDETRYLAVAWEMWWRGDFLLPWLNGEPYSHKPPLLFWLIHALWALFGVSELAARFPAFWCLRADAVRLEEKSPGKIVSTTSETSASFSVSAHSCGGICR